MKRISEDLTFDEMSLIMSDILNGKNNDEEIAGFLRELSDKGETDEAYDLLDIISGSSVFIHYMC